MKARFLITLAVVVAGCSHSSSEIPPYVASKREAASLSRQWAVRELRVSHPRVLVNSDRFAEIKKIIATEPVPRAWAAKVRERATAMLDDKPIESRPHATLEISRMMLTRMLHLGAEYLLTGDVKYAARAKRDMLVVAGFADWSPNDFLATAEMTAALAIGYDWTFDQLNDADRRTIRAAIIEKGLMPGRTAYQQPASWTQAHHNWNLVCNGGLVMGALAVHEDQPDLCREILNHARSSLNDGLEAFGPDGGWEEGPTYWNYASRYLAFYIASLRSAYGNDFGLTKTRGLARTGDFRIHTIGPTGLNFNFADAEPLPGDSPQMFEFSDAFDKPVYAAFEQARSGKDPGVLDLLWYRATDLASVKDLPRAAMFRGVEVACFRGSWDDPNTTYVATKGGNNKAHHGHLDLGSFVLDSLGQRWAMDLGADNYDLPGYSSELRWTYYRCSTAGHNTITLNGVNQNPTIATPITAFRSASDRSFAVMNLTDAYAPAAKQVMRGVALLNGRDVLVQDEINPRDLMDVAWTMHTDAKIDIKGQRATLTKNGVRIVAILIAPENAKFTVEPVQIPSPQKLFANGKRLMIRIRTDKFVRMAVLFTPAPDSPMATPIQPLSAWRNASR